MENFKNICKVLDRLMDCFVIFDQNGSIIYQNPSLKNNLAKHKKHGIVLLDTLADNCRKIINSNKAFAAEKLKGLSISQCIDLYFLLCKGSDHTSDFVIVMVKFYSMHQRDDFLYNTYSNFYTINYDSLDKELLPEFLKIKGNDLEFKRILLTAQKIATTELPVLITGKSGTGKEVLARAIQQTSLKKNKPFVDVNCAAIPENLIESELFGYEKGAFTGAKKDGHRGLFEEAHEGTIFLDEIGDTSLGVQSKLLRVLEEGCFKKVGGTRNIHVNVRIISATNKNLTELISKKNFREDLFYRLNTAHILLPSLHERRGDIQLLADYFLNSSKSMPIKERLFSKEVLFLFKNYDWPGNIRELKGVVEYSAAVSESHEIGIEDLPPFLFLEKMSLDKNDPFYDQEFDLSPKTGLLTENLEKFEKSIIETAIKKTKNKTEAIRLLGVSRRTFYTKIKKYNLTTMN